MQSERSPLPSWHEPFNATLRFTGWTSAALEPVTRTSCSTPDRTNTNRRRTEVQMIPNAKYLVHLRQDELLREAKRAHLVRMFRAERQKAK